MVRRIHRRPRADSQVNQARRGGGTLGRRIYLLLLVLLAITVGNYIWGDKLLFRADGLVLQDRTALAATSVVRVEEVFVRRGQQVRKGDTLLRVGSADILDRIADQTSRDSELAQRESALRSRLQQVKELQPIAARRAADAAEMLQSVKSARQRGVVPSVRLSEAMRENFDAQTVAVGLATELASLGQEIEVLAASRRATTDSLRDLREHYGAGMMLASQSGTIGHQVPDVGEVFRPGDAITSVHYGAPYVLAFLPDSYIFSIEVGDMVNLDNGRQEASGQIVEILPVSQNLPREFLAAFEPGKTRQLARVSLTQEAAFPVGSDVYITHPLPNLPATAMRVWNQYLGPNVEWMTARLRPAPYQEPSKL